MKGGSRLRTVRGSLKTFDLYSGISVKSNHDPDPEHQPTAFESGPAIAKRMAASLMPFLENNNPRKRSADLLKRTPSSNNSFPPLNGTTATALASPRHEFCTAGVQQPVAATEGPLGRQCSWAGHVLIEQHAQHDQDPGCNPGPATAATDPDSPWSMLDNAVQQQAAAPPGSSGFFLKTGATPTGAIEPREPGPAQGGWYAQPDEPPVGSLYRCVRGAEDPFGQSWCA